MKKIEILAPAGSLEQGYSAISAGCDAVYGGLKLGNARQRAKNFSLSEYSRMLQYCKKKNVKFYLTLNTLLRTDELEELLDLLGTIDLPDAVIIADLGLMLSVRNRFPSLPVHASTQFGAVSLNDVLFLESIGVTRAILSRELTLDEIKYIKNHSRIELEVFVFGTQCVLFSGQCLWGGLISENSGNRGKCNGMCRDFYNSAGITGQFMYPRDLEIGTHLKALEQIGVCSAKIEGRLRPASETEQVLNTIKSGCFTTCYASYLSNQLPVAEMFQAVNPRIRYSAESSAHYTSHDLLYCQNHYIYGNQLLDNAECNYIKTVYYHSLTDGVNISLKLKYKERVLETISYINPSGEKKLISLRSKTVKVMKVSELCSTILHLLHYNVYELISEIPDLELINADMNAVFQICDKINQQCRAEYPVIQGQNRIKAEKSMLIQTDKVSDIIRFANHGYKKFIFEIGSQEELEKVLFLKQDIVFRLPMFYFHEKLETILKKLAGKKIMLTKNSQLLFLKKYTFSSVSADYSVNCWNKQALEFLKSYGVSATVVHPELELNATVNRIRESGLTPIVMIAGKIPLGFTRACFGELHICNHQCNSTIKMNNINKGYDICIACTNPSGFKSVYRDGIDVSFSSEGVFEKLLIISRFSEEMKQALLYQEYLALHQPNYLYRRNVK